MEIKTQVVDNFLKDEDFGELIQLTNFGEIPYNISMGVSGYESYEEVRQNALWNWYGTHTVYDYNQPRSSLYELTTKIFSKISGEMGLGYGLIRSKINFYPYTNIVYEHGPHKDYDFFNYGAVLSLNTCNGFTRLEDGTKIDSVANRMLFFDASKLHNSSTTSDAPGRFNINLNFR